MDKKSWYEWTKLRNGHISVERHMGYVITLQLGIFNLLVGGLDHFLFFHVLGIIIPIDELIFFRWFETTNQYINMYAHDIVV